MYVINLKKINKLQPETERHDKKRRKKTIKHINESIQHAEPTNKNNSEWPSGEFTVHVFC